MVADVAIYHGEDLFYFYKIVWIYSKSDGNI